VCFNTQLYRTARDRILTNHSRVSLLVIRQLMMSTSLCSDITIVQRKIEGFIMKVQRLESNLDCITRIKADVTETLMFCINRKQEEFVVKVRTFTEHTVYETVLDSCKIIHAENKQSMYMYKIKLF